MKKFLHKINKYDKKYYSLNFLLSENLKLSNNPKKIKKTKLNIKKKKSIDSLHSNLDQRNYYFYKPISKIINKY